MKTRFLLKYKAKVVSFIGSPSIAAEKVIVSPETAVLTAVRSEGPASLVELTSMVPAWATHAAQINSSVGNRDVRLLRQWDLK
ncbi:MAG: hypothetical protein ACJA01_000334 [Saprospiraceae bacterium]|jgi:hypothetical protein